MREEFFNFFLHSCVELIILVDQIKKWHIYSIYTIIQIIKYITY